MSPRRGTTHSRRKRRPIADQDHVAEQQRVSARVLPYSQSVSGDVDMVLTRSFSIRGSSALGSLQAEGWVSVGDQESGVGLYS
jgi:hypothetical protein